METQSDATGDHTSDVTSVVQARHVVLAGSGDVSSKLCPELNRCVWVYSADLGMQPVKDAYTGLAIKDGVKIN